MKGMKTRAQLMYDFLAKQTAEGRTCYLSTALRVTKIQAKHMSQVRVRGATLEVQCGKRWLDYTHTALSAE